jgi:hypothetical protein
MKVLHGAWSCSLKQINKGTIKAWGGGGKTLIKTSKNM